MTCCVPYAEILLQFLAPSVPEADTEKTVQRRENLFLLPVQGTWRLGAAPALGAHAFTLRGPLGMTSGWPSPVPLLGGGRVCLVQGDPRSVSPEHSCQMLRFAWGPLAASSTRERTAWPPHPISSSALGDLAHVSLGEGRR